MTDPTHTSTDVQSQDDPKPTGPTFTAEQEAEINRRMAATRKQAEADAKRKFDSDAETRQKDADAEAERKRQEAAGEFDKVKVSLEGERDSFKSRAETAEARAERAIELLRGGIADKVKTLTERDAELAKAFPADADVLDQIAWLDDPRTKRVLADDQTQNGFRQPRTPTPAAPLNAAQQAEERARQLAQSGQYSAL